ncbi:YbfB/YjiJ family MFS transporter [uncultured Nocardioides sp.]|uniref:YbfB/YjiJ family MFS transporter n=1 Tax=uncultured Nocardioides sp. TaxID=198441 RepID=UPI00262F0A66|nr:YbfB/YjiJ family MFS transporter [uncultured Nocardioides sp.]
MVGYPDASKEAVQHRAGWRSWRVAIAALMAVAAIAQGFSRFTYPFLIQNMREDFLGSYTVAGLLGTANLGTYATAVLFMTVRPPRRLGAAALIKLGLLACCAGLVAISLASEPWMMFAGMCLTGVGSALAWIPASGLVALIAPPQRRGLAYGLMNMSVGAAIALAGLLTHVTQQALGADAWREVWVAATVFSFVLLAIAFTCMPRSEAVVELGQRRLRRLRARIPVTRMCSSNALFGVGFAIYVNYLIVVLQDAGMTSDQANRAYSIMGLTSVVSAILLGRLSDHLHRSRTLGVAILITGICAAATTVTTNVLMLTGAVGLFGLMMSGIGTVLSAYISDESAPSEVPVVFGFTTLSLAVALLLAPPAAGWLADSTGSFRLSYLLGAVAAAVGGLLAWTLPSTRRAGADGPRLTRTFR